MGNGASKQNKAKIVIEKSLRNFNCQPAFIHPVSVESQTAKSTSTNLKQLITILWFDSNSVSQDNIIDTQITKTKLSNCFENSVLNCVSDLNSCIECLQHYENTVDIVFLVVSGRDSMILFDNLTSNLLRCIDSIFIFCLSEKLYKARFLREKKVAGVYHEHADLIQAIQEQVKHIIQQDIILKYYSQTQKTGHTVPSHAKGEFIWIRALKEAMLNVEKTEKNIKNMIDRFRILYRRDANALENINEFEANYRSEYAIQWYTKDSFLYRIINQSLRTEKTDELLLVAPYVGDLCRAIRSLKSVASKTNTFFRGCTLSMRSLEEFKMHIGSYLTINTFFSASRQRDVAKAFASCHLMGGNTKDVSVLFEIEIKHGNQPFFADISSLSVIRDEEEVLFDLNAIFEIHNITYSDVDECWIISLIADEEIYMLHDGIYKELCETLKLNEIPLITVGYSLLLLGNTRDAYHHACYVSAYCGYSFGVQTLVIVTCIAECNYKMAIDYATWWYEHYTKSKSFDLHSRWTFITCWLADILISLGEYKLAGQYIKSVVKYYRNIKDQTRFSFTIPMDVPTLVKMERYVIDEDEIGLSRFLLSIFEDTSITLLIRNMILPSVRCRLARYFINNNRFKEAFDHLQTAEIEGELLLSANGVVRLDIHLAYACLCIHTRMFDLSDVHLNEVEKIARNDLSRSCPSGLGCMYILRELITVLQENATVDTCLPLARTAFLKANNYIDVPRVVFILSTLCKIHEWNRNNLRASSAIKLDKLLIDTFQICHFKNIMEGKSPDNIYYSLVKYVEQINCAQLDSTDLK